MSNEKFEQIQKDLLQSITERFVQWGDGYLTDQEFVRLTALAADKAIDAAAVAFGLRGKQP